ncbi:PH domain-containing protein [Streptomyces pilosus]|uniref:Membrane protein n=1 Tax=Streptomyces pilosus TaxID=28893 RepID=A0A918BMJ9_9ACTN|nr:PH domain-containing protein [Streptomyces pilosus]GGQ80568.1 membrane protein [Streptomyces pilosus]GGV48796.1 membrane protein [Streptomyces pilosus]
MTTPEDQSPDPEPTKPAGSATPPYKDRIYRSPAALVGGVLLLAVAGWLGVDAVVVGEGRTPWLALALLLLVVPLVVAYTLRPAVYVNDDRLRVRNPFRVIVLPWGQVASLRSGFSNEVVTLSGEKYQLWALPVSLRARGRAARHESRAAARAARAAHGGGGAGAAGGVGLDGLGTGGAPAGPRRHESDRAMEEMRELRERRHDAEAAQGEVTVRWAYEVVGPAVAGAVLLGVLLGVG